jgi:hypothetical protein
MQEGSGKISIMLWSGTMERRRVRIHPHRLQGLPKAMGPDLRVSSQLSVINMLSTKIALIVLLCCVEITADAQIGSQIVGTWLLERDERILFIDRSYNHVIQPCY